MSLEKTYKLSDSTTGTAKEFAEQSGIAIGTIQGRLKKTRDVNKVFRSVAKARKDSGWHKVGGRLVFENSNEQVPV